MRFFNVRFLQAGIFNDPGFIFSLPKVLGTRLKIPTLEGKVAFNGLLNPVLIQASLCC